MTAFSIIAIILGIIVLVGIGVVVYLLFEGGNMKNKEVRGLMGSRQTEDVSFEPDPNDDLSLKIEEIKRRTGSARVRGQKREDTSVKLFKAGYYSAADRKKYRTFQIIAAIAGGIILCGLGGLAGSKLLILCCGVIGFLSGPVIPSILLDRKIARRQEEIMYFLPLVIEQVSIGVSSSLDIGPCISNIVTMANGRDSHNPITEMFLHVEKLIRSGLNLEDALTEVAEISGMVEIKHSFMFMGQCAKHGGEISKQLQDLADSVMVQRQVQVEGRIAALPVKATGPLAMVFAGYFSLILSGLFVKLLTAFTPQ